MLRNNMQYMYNICIVFLCPLACPFIILSILDRITSQFQRWSLTNELPVAEVLRHQYIKIGISPLFIVGLRSNLFR